VVPVEVLKQYETQPWNVYSAAAVANGFGMISEHVSRVASSLGNLPQAEPCLIDLLIGEFKRHASIAFGD